MQRNINTPSVSTTIPANAAFRVARRQSAKAVSFQQAKNCRNEFPGDVLTGTVNADAGEYPEIRQQQQNQVEA